MNKYFGVSRSINQRGNIMPFQLSLNYKMAEKLRRLLQNSYNQNSEASRAVLYRLTV